MAIGIGIAWKKPLDIPAARSLFERVIEALVSLGHRKIYIERPGRGALDSSKHSMEYFFDAPASSPLAIRRLSPIEITEHEQERGVRGAIQFSARLPISERPYRGLGWQTLMGPIPEQTDADVQRHLDRLIHVTVPRRICVGPEKWFKPAAEPPLRDGALVYLDAKGVELAKSLSLGIKLAAGAAGGGWVRAHASGLDATEDDALESIRLLGAALARIDMAEHRERYPSDTSRTVGTSSAAAPALAPGAVAVAATTAMKAAADQNRIASLDPDATAMPFANSAPVLPFQGKLSEEEARARYQAPIGQRPAREVGAPGYETMPTDETVALPIPAGVRESFGPVDAPAPMQLEQYAALRAQLTLHGETNSAVFREFGIRSEAEKEGLQRYWFARFQSDPAVAAGFQRMVAIALARLREAGVR